LDVQHLSGHRQQRSSDTPYNWSFPETVGGDLDAGVAAQPSPDSTVGDPAGSLKVVVTFTGNNQQVNPNADWASRLLSRLDEQDGQRRHQGDPAVPATFTGGGIQLFAQDAPGPAGTMGGLPDRQRLAYLHAEHGWYHVGPDANHTIHGPILIAQYASPADGGVASVFTPVTVTAYIDNITVQRPP